MEDISRFVKGHGLRVRFEGKQIAWSTDKSIPGFLQVRRRHHMMDNEFHPIHYKDDFYLLYQNQNGIYLISSDANSGFSRALWGLILSLVGITFFLIFFLIIVKRTLNPLKYLMKGVTEVSTGNFDYRIQKTGKDELGELSRAYNFMAQRISEMLHMRKQLLLDVSHELRSPITRARIALEFLEDGKPKSNILEELDTLESMTSEILESERLESGFGVLEQVRTDVFDMINRFMRPYIENGHVQITKETSKLIYSPVDEKRLSIAFKNIIENCLKYSDTHDNPVQILIDSDDRVVKIEIIDHGSGIPEEDIPFIFEPFYRVDKSRNINTGGYGLGLHLVKKIITAHKGEISIRSELEKGTTVIISLPCDKNELY
ncbi:MAG: HAMP domain-containing histidine kinase [Deltaproteobacteria bacterium]|nr:HAMP domain-containing histidine kinase [Deltaproteobacteria bacterium]